jgi:hypothetical protein
VVMTAAIVANMMTEVRLGRGMEPSFRASCVNADAPDPTHKEVRGNRRSTVSSASFCEAFNRSEAGPIELSRCRALFRPTPEIVAQAGQ